MYNKVHGRICGFYGTMLTSSLGYHNRIPLKRNGSVLIPFEVWTDKANFGYCQTMVIEVELYLLVLLEPRSFIPFQWPCHILRSNQRQTVTKIQSCIYRLIFTDPVQMAISTFTTVSSTRPNVTPTQDSSLSKYSLSIFGDTCACTHTQAHAHAERERERQRETERERDRDRDRETERDRESKSNTN